VKSHLGDFYRAAGALDLEGEDVTRVAALLGLDARAAIVAAPPAPPRPEPFVDGGTTRKPGGHEAAEGARPAALLARAFPTGPKTTDESQPGWFSSTTPFPIEKARYRSAKLPLDPLLAPRGARNIVAAVAATNAAEGEIDIERIVAHVARGEVLLGLHRRGTVTTRNGLQLLIDRSESMTFFARDAIWVEQQIVHVVGADRVQSLRFAELPQRGIGRSGEEWRAYRPPIAGVPILVLTDLGIGGTSVALAAAEWAAFAKMVKAAGCPVVALVPYPPQRWPEAAVRTMTIAQWERSLDARRARMAMRQAQKVLG
jgi:hypothetical protein